MRKYLCYLSLILNFLFTGFVLYQLFEADNNSYFPPVDAEVQNAATIDVRQVLENTAFENVASKLTLANYYSSKNVLEFNKIETDFKIIDSLFPSEIFNLRSNFYYILTDSLKQNISKNNSVLDLNTLEKLQNFQIRYYYYAEAANNIDNKSLYSAVSDYWGRFVAEKLSGISENGFGSKIDFKYRYLAARSSHYRFSADTKTYSTEKVIKYLLDTKWGHLLNASWNQASMVQKIIFGLILLLTILAYIVLIKEIRKHFYKK